MELKTNSVSARVYREVYNTRHMPESLCPYFWKLVLGYPLIVVLLPLLIPTWIIMKFQKDGYDSDFPMGPKSLMGVLIYGFVFMVFVVGVFISSYWITYYQGTHWYGWYVSGFIVIFVALVGSIIFLISKLKERRRQKRRERLYNENGYYLPVEEKSNLIVEFIKAKYNKYCPKITWK